VADVSPNWMVNGEYGMVQFSATPPKASVSVTAEGYRVDYDAAMLEKQWQSLVGGYGFKK